ncbi:hypothetical protein P152DRAFT_455956 [Eremomyces bilateralis CBS 781.70]|uniref:Uncharacterized protein n=1 Tax=Eremomyces bilateralis CBS 781.70 TaxID=1392243 RepID=A0A6G1GA83_9PEZI|nr:uncharacterized protein P152DRAFT_455956 [Eremomyces bilateralis CBS 781.70]KAF1814912.1 hypothetical protein P152DRAFT_455956 [Eremomyces bilateralis CBS 781.70]
MLLLKEVQARTTPVSKRQHRQPHRVLRPSPPLPRRLSQPPPLPLTTPWPASTTPPLPPQSTSYSVPDPGIATLPTSSNRNGTASTGTGTSAHHHRGPRWSACCASGKRSEMGPAGVMRDITARSVMSAFVERVCRGGGR